MMVTFYDLSAYSAFAKKLTLVGYEQNASYRQVKRVNKVEVETRAIDIIAHIKLEMVTEFMLNKPEDVYDFIPAFLIASNETEVTVKCCFNCKLSNMEKAWGDV